MKKIILIGMLLLILITSGCVSDEALERKAEKVAQGFSIAWQKEDYNSLYDFFPNTLKSMRNKDDFVRFVHATNPTEFKLIYDKTILQNKKEAYAYYTFVGSYLFQPKTPAFHMIYEKREWKIDAFAHYFTDLCAEESCMDGNACTLDLCNNETDFLCKHELIEGCCRFDFECSDLKPYCHNNSCYEEECFDDKDCGSSKPACLNNKCVECVINEQCPYYNPECYNNKCVECISDQNCPSYKPACNNYKCVECIKNYHCKDEDHPQCSDGECVQCISNSDCISWGWYTTYASGEIKDLKACKKSRVGNKYNKCVECTSDQDCTGEEPYCWQTYNTCTKYDFN